MKQLTIVISILFISCPAIYSNIIVPVIWYESRIERSFPCPYQNRVNWASISFTNFSSPCLHCVMLSVCLPKEIYMPSVLTWFVGAMFVFMAITEVYLWSSKQLLYGKGTPCYRFCNSWFFTNLETKHNISFVILLIQNSSKFGSMEVSFIQNGSPNVIGELSYSIYGKLSQ